MTKGLQVILQDPEYREIQRMARSRHMSIAEWVRQALELARRREPVGDSGKKLAIIRAAVQYDFPVSAIDEMLATSRRVTGADPICDSRRFQYSMYLVGAAHPHKSDAQRLLEKLVSERQRLVTPDIQFHSDDAFLVYGAMDTGPARSKVGIRSLISFGGNVASSYLQRESQCRQRLDRLVLGSRSARWDATPLTAEH